MKAILKSLVLYIVMSGSQCTSNLTDQLQGNWLYMDDMECPDVIFFHKSGRYVVWNDCVPPLYRLVAISERGDWAIKNKTIVLSNREFFPNYSSFRKYHGSDSTLLFKIKQLSNKELLVSFNLEEENCSESYRKVKHFSDLVCTYSGFSSSTKKMILPPSIQATLLKLSYKSLFDRPDLQEPIELVIQDQDGHEIYKRALAFTEDVQREEILLVDNLELTNLTELIFEINTGKLSPGWEIKATVY